MTKKAQGTERRFASRTDFDIAVNASSDPNAVMSRRPSDAAAPSVVQAMQSLRAAAPQFDVAAVSCENVPMALLNCSWLTPARPARMP